MTLSHRPTPKNWQLPPEVGAVGPKDFFQNAGQRVWVSSITRGTLLRLRHEPTKSWTEHGPNGMILGGRYAPFLPVVFEIRISYSDQAYKL